MAAREALEASGVLVWAGRDGELWTKPPPVALTAEQFRLLLSAMRQHRHGQRKEAS